MLSRRSEIAVQVRLAWPMVLSQAAAMMLWVVDALMLGGLSVEALDAASIGRIWVMGTLIFGMGLVLGLDPLAAQAHGAGDRKTLVLVGQQGLAAVLWISPVIIGLWLITEPVLLAFGQSPELAAEARRFVYAQLPGAPMYLGYIVLRHWLQAQGVTRPILMLIVLANVVNAFLNWLLIFGHWGLPALGTVGSGLSTGLTLCFLFGGSAAVVRYLDRETRAWRQPDWREVFQFAALRRLFRLGLPVGFGISLEFWAFSISTLWAGWLGAQALAAHTVAINLASLTFTLPLGLSFATVTRVGNLLGADDPPGAQRAAWMALWLVAGSMTALAGVLFLGRVFLPGLYTDDAQVIAMAAAVLPVAAAFQLSDGIQAVGSGILRGMGRTLPAALFNLVGYYAIALPLAWWLAFPRGWGLGGIWWGLALGLTLVAAALLLWIGVRGPARARRLAGIHRAGP